jgi:hypothetical protein
MASEVRDKLENIINHVRQSAKNRNDGERFVREVLRAAKEARITDTIPPEQVEALAAEGWLRPLARGRTDSPAELMELATQRRNHKLMLKLLRHPDDTMRAFAAEHFQLLFAMLDGYYDEASALINQILLMPTEIPAVKYALLRDMGRSSRHGLPREIGDTARRLIHDLDQGVSYHALRLLSFLYDMRDWRSVLDRMISLVGEDEEAAHYFLAAGVEYFAVLVPHEPEVVNWMKSLIEEYPPEHMVVAAVAGFVRSAPDVALNVGLITRRDYNNIVGQ